jgi:hypothetical protein
VFYNEAQLPGRQLVAHETSVDASHKPVSGQSIDVDSSAATIAFISTGFKLACSLLSLVAHEIIIP